jgi:excisionase family DNA binding protein
MGHVVPRASALREAVNNQKVAVPQVAALLNVAEVCSRLRISKWTLYRLIQAQELKTVKIGSRRLIRAQSLEAFIDRLEAEAGD